LAAELGIASAVRFLTGLPKQELAACYARADIFALPSTGEGFGLVFLEAMECAKPIVAAAGDSTDLVEHNVNGLLIAPRDRAALSNALDRLLRDSSKRSTLGQRRAEIVRRKYRFDLFQSQFAPILGA
jgi:glycosyltransferase involved in cell wall biosynthesis